VALLLSSNALHHSEGAGTTADNAFALPDIERHLGSEQYAARCQNAYEALSDQVYNQYHLHCTNLNPRFGVGYFVSATFQSTGFDLLVSEALTAATVI